ncbi:unnamed protein product, partial [Medioppia subpectinata]
MSSYEDQSGDNSDQMSLDVKDTQEVQEEEEDADEEELSAEYVVGGYHCVQIGDTFRNNRYRVIRKLGWGAFSTVWLCLDSKTSDYVAIKIVKSKKSYQESAEEEIEMLSQIQRSDPTDPFAQRVVQFLNHFKIRGPNGKHHCLVFEVLGDSLIKYMKNSHKKGISMEILKIIIRQVLQGLEYLHTKCLLIHTDIKPENILLTTDKRRVKRLHSQVIDMIGVCGETQLPTSFVSTAPAKVLKKCDTYYKQNRSASLQKLLKLNVKTNDNDVNHNVLNEEDMSELSVKLADLGNACYVYENHNSTIQTRPYRSPEVILGAAFGPSADIWSTACMAFELATGDILFDSHQSGDTSRNENHLKLILELLGPIPKTSRKGIDQIRPILSPKEWSNHCLVFEVLGDSLIKYMKNSHKKGISMEILKIIIRQVLQGLDYLHTKCLLIHTDIKPENILLTTDKRRVKRLHSQVIDVIGVCGETQLPTSFVSTASAKVLKKCDTYYKQNRSASLQKLLKLNVKTNDNDVNHNVLNEEDMSELSVKLADLGNACYVYENHNSTIQTRPYRSPEVILGAAFGPSADIWSTACMAFELATGDILFDSHQSGDTSRNENHLKLILQLLDLSQRHFELATGDILFDSHQSGDTSRNENHLKLILELLGPIPKTSRKGKNTSTQADATNLCLRLAIRYGELLMLTVGSHRVLKRVKNNGYELYDSTKRITASQCLRQPPLCNTTSIDQILINDYEWHPSVAQEFAQFLLPMLEIDSTKRITASQCLHHPWLNS